MKLHELLRGILEHDKGAVAELRAWCESCPVCQLHLERVAKTRGARVHFELNDWEDHRVIGHKTQRAIRRVMPN